jgi:biotin transport system substrate-specific component
LTWKIGAVFVGTLILAISSYIEVPMYPVPVTLQTLSVTLIGALYGWRLGGITIMAWLFEGAMGFPVFSGGGAGVPHLIGPTGGYLFAFPIAGMIMGWFFERNWATYQVGWLFVGMLISNALCLLIGATWLAAFIGVKQAIMAGVMPFLLGAVIKSLLGALILKQVSGRISR